MAFIKKTQDNSVKVNKDITPIERPIPKIQTEPKRQGPKLEEITSIFGNIKGQRDSSSRISDKVLQDLLNERGGGPGAVAAQPPAAPSASPSPTPTISVTPSTTPSNTPSNTPSTTPEVSPSNTPSVTPSISPSVTATPTPTPSNGPLFNLPITKTVEGSNSEIWRIKIDSVLGSTVNDHQITATNTVNTTLSTAEGNHIDVFVARSGDADFAGDTTPDSNGTITITVSGTNNGIYNATGHSNPYLFTAGEDFSAVTYHRWRIFNVGTDTTVTVTVNEGNV